MSFKRKKFFHVDVDVDVDGRGSTYHMKSS
jgi:hypothetical protein